MKKKAYNIKISNDSSKYRIFFTYYSIFRNRLYNMHIIYKTSLNMNKFGPFAYLKTIFFSDW